MNRIDRLLSVVAAAVTWISYILLTLMVINTAAGVFFRYVLQNAIPWTEELGRYMMVYAGFLGCVLAMRENSHVGVEMVTGLFPPGVQTVFKAAARLVVAGFIVVVLTATPGQLASLRIQKSSALEIPMVIPYLSVTIGLVLMLIENLAHLARLFAAPTTPQSRK